ncbi:MAG: metallophosphoesterase family protein [Anaerolineaceae bacterium]|jgi:putative phosphoesterase|nr:metallophosphoesterase family protein [Anaerolineaceae bacterium]MDD4043434.1 metallophosphoesterase family protein [Anaerolineaceae bacterium]MDD4578186.1 metallophosphoesterase family protein [Anaerolineaceae bacterium]
MNKIAVFSDIHGNLPALQAVMRDLDERGIEHRYSLGDLVGYGTFPNEVIQLIREHKIPTVMGNYDEGIGNSSDECGCAYKTDEEKALGKRSIAWTNMHTTEENKAYLRSLLPQIPLQLGDLKVLLAHGSPRKINEYLYIDRPDATLERILDFAEADVLVVGHTHKPYHRILPSGRHVINEGSVGKPKDGDPRAAYVILQAEGRDLSVEFVRVPYDVEAIATAIEASEMPSEYAAMLRTATG